MIRELLFADDAALISHTEDGLQQLVSRFSRACKEFGLTISLKKTNIMAQDAGYLPVITINDQNLEVVNTFTYLGSKISSSLSIDEEVNSRIGKAAAAMAKLDGRVWSNPRLTERTRLCIYQACITSTLLYGSETWTTYASHERRMNSFHLRCLRRILGIRWEDKVPNTEVLIRANFPSMHAILSERRLRWLGHVRRMDQGRIPKDLFYGELAIGSRKTGRPRLRYKDVCKRDMKSASIETADWERLAHDRSIWRSTVREGTRNADMRRREEQAKKRDRRKGRILAQSQYICSICMRDCHSRVGLLSHARRY